MKIGNDDLAAVGGSFRDPSGQVYLSGDKVYRTVMESAVEDYEFVRDSGFYAALVKQDRAVPAKDVTGEVDHAEGVRYLLEHPRLRMISHPYEWSFPQLKAAALCHLDIQLDALDHDITLSDASAFNIQFIGARPIFIDTLSFRRYKEGEYWEGYRQFCEQFLNPLLLRACLGVTHNAWYRGTQEGISAGDLARLLPWRRKLSIRTLLHVVLQARFQNAAMTKSSKSHKEFIKKSNFPREGYRRMLRGLRKWIEGLEPADTGKTVWSDYAGDNSYTSDEARGKHGFVREFVESIKPDVIWDFGCNTGDYSHTALEAGAGAAVSFDFDQRALETAFARASSENLSMTPLFLDAANPSPSQGWRQRERAGLSERAAADAMVALAFVHHLAIARNVPLDDVVDWLTGMAPQGIIEFVPKNDPMVQELLSLRRDIFPNYTEEAFRARLLMHGEIVTCKKVTASGRTLFWYRRAA